MLQDTHTLQNTLYKFYTSERYKYWTSERDIWSKLVGLFFF